MFRINATNSTNSLNLAEIHSHFDDSTYPFGKNGGTERCKILGFKFGGGIFKEIHVDSCDEENWVWRLTIAESGFEDNEYEINGKVMLSIEYERRLREVIREKCVTCDHFKGDPDNLDGHYERLRLDGYCWGYENTSEDKD